MKTRVDVITGFLESGKTTFLNAISMSGMIRAEETVVFLLCEQGEVELDTSGLACKAVYIKTLQYDERPDEFLFYDLQRKYQPSRIIIEYNGTWELEDLFLVRLPHKTSIGKVIFLADAHTYMFQIRNMTGLVSGQIRNSDAVILNRSQDVAGESLEAIRKSIININRSALVVQSPKVEFAAKWPWLQKYLSKESEPISMKAAGIIFILSIFWAILLFSGTVPAMQFTTLYQGFLEINTAFLSILIQALPFLLLGVFISALLQTYISEEHMIRLFSRKYGLGFLAAIILGAFFPVCDCAMVPITARLIRRGTPIPQTMTFMLASPAVNPIVILSTWYAFQGDAHIVVWRIAAGVAIAVCMGAALRIFEKGRLLIREDVILPEAARSVQTQISIQEKKSILLLRQAGAEFFRTGPLLVAGAFLGSVITHFLQADYFTDLSQTKITAVLILLLASFFMSICSNSNAFVGKNFSSVFPLSAALGFMVMGPMLDLKNLLVLRSAFSKKFILLYVVTLFLLSLIGFSVLTMLTGGTL